MTNLIRTVLEWGAAVLLGRRTPGKRAHAALHPYIPCGAPLAGACGLRPGPTAQPSEPYDSPGALVRPYVARLDAELRTARAGAHVDPWGAARWG
ncbi:hypothetical protein GCM10010368_25960 [Streptomyces roseiscleroticus]|uniref:Uncharacterized protein n=1 Tax=Streptomyces roseiscleroticus TaxID=1972 RepID=A0ABP5RF91_9ACTN